MFLGEQIETTTNPIEWSSVVSLVLLHGLLGNLLVFIFFFLFSCVFLNFRKYLNLSRLPCSSCSYLFLFVLICLLPLSSMLKVFLVRPSQSQSFSCCFGISFSDALPLCSHVV